MHKISRYRLNVIDLSCIAIVSASSVRYCAMFSAMLTLFILVESKRKFTIVVQQPVQHQQSNNGQSQNKNTSKEALNSLKYICKLYGNDYLFGLVLIYKHDLSFILNNDNNSNESILSSTLRCISNNSINETHNEYQLDSFLGSFSKLSIIHYIINNCFRLSKAPIVTLIQIKSGQLLSTAYDTSIVTFVEPTDTPPPNA